MLVLKWILIILAGLLILGALLVTIGLYWLSKNQPTTAEVANGIRDGRFKPCPDTPNCVSTQADPQDETHYVEPIPFDGSREQLLALLEEWIHARDGTEILSRSDDYLHAVFSSKFFGFKDDLELYIPDAAHHVHLRSAARVGRGDMGVNRSRYQAIRAHIREPCPPPTGPAE